MYKMFAYHILQVGYSEPHFPIAEDCSSNARAFAQWSRNAVGGYAFFVP